jgi:glycosyltransferase involved in cell wall biosynthesis
VLPNKGQLSVVEALRRVADLPWRARLVGSLDRDPGYAEDVRAAVTAAGLSTRIALPGVLPRDEAWTGADLALLPSRVEAFGLVVTEALARGVPAVVSEGGAAEALGGADGAPVPGIVVPPADVDALADAVRRWLTDEALRHELRARALERRTSLPGWGETANDVSAALSTR